MKHKWMPDEVKRKEKIIENKEMKERLESIWEVLQSLNGQPKDLSSQKIAIQPQVKGSLKRSAS